ncbi:MAG: DUF3048 domain-containing protein [Clostridia bacterium]|nr:DUF3048 domain-containing protein [Clostridia bacterium]
MNRKNLTILIVLLVIITYLSACDNDKSSVSKNTSTKPETSKVSTAEEQTNSVQPEKKEDAKKNDFVFPIDGIRPMAVMIDNEGNRPLPQGGLYKAQVIYEIIVEGGVTRLMPVFWNTEPEMIGPVRSSRHYFIDYAMEHDAIYVHFGYSPQALSDLKKFKINNVNGVANGGEVFWDLTKDRYNWQDSYTSPQKVSAYTKRVKYRTTTDKKSVFSFNTEDTALVDGQKAEKILVKYSNDYKCSYVYDTATSMYMRFRKDKPHTDRITKDQLSAKNIIIQYVGNNRIKGDTKDRQELGNVGKGKGLFITNGKVIEITWSKASRTAPTKYNDTNGNAIRLNPGQTWIQIVPKSNPASIS